MVSSPALEAHALVYLLSRLVERSVYFAVLPLPDGLYAAEVRDEARQVLEDELTHVNQRYPQ